MKNFLPLSLLLLFFTQTALAAPSQVSACLNINVDPPRNVDMAKVRDTWLSWYNDARAKNGLAPYVYNEALNETAANWSFYAVKRGFISHQRAGQASYYDYRKVGSWFASKGVRFADGGGRSDYVENIGWDYYSCSKADCTDDLITAIKHTYNFFMSEKNKKYRAHYESIMNSDYHEIGLGIAVDPVKKRYYLTVHYGTDVIEKDVQTQRACTAVTALQLGDHKF